jgi:hypothetical protein
MGEREQIVNVSLGELIDREDVPTREGGVRNKTRKRERLLQSRWAMDSIHNPRGGMCLHLPGGRGGHGKLGNGEVWHGKSARRFLGRVADDRRRDIFSGLRRDKRAVQEDRLAVKDDSVHRAFDRFA